MARFAKQLALALLALALALAGAGAFRQWRAHAMVRQEQMALARAESLLQAGQAGAALALAESFAKGQAGGPWAKLEMAALTEQQDFPRLALLYERTPERILADEAASLLVARAFLHARKSAEYGRIREAWRGREHPLEGWLALDSDAFLLAGKPRESERLLRSQPLPGPADATRLVRLALVTAKQDLYGAWRLLAQAAALQPQNPDIRSFRAQILEAAGRTELARVEYVAALVAAPQNPLLRDRLADFYLRHRNFDLALDTWTEALARPTLDFLWLKAHFGSRVLRPVNFSSFPPPPKGDLEPLMLQIACLPAHRFFDPNAFAQLSRARNYAAQRPEVFWLRLLDALQMGREKEAFELLQFQPASLRAWEPDLAAALYRILYYRQKHSLNPPELVFTSDLAETNRPPLFLQVEEAARQERTTRGSAPLLSAGLATLLQGPEAFSAALLAAGWREAALTLWKEHPLIPGAPDWLGYGYAQALRLNRSPQAALTFLGTAELAPPLALLQAELLVEVGRRAEALAPLASLARLDSSVGLRAACLLALDAAENHRWEAAREFVLQQPLLAQADLGKELLARLALAQGRTSEAEIIYRGIVGRSVEAKTWFARQAFAQRHWQEARQLTMELLDLIPDSSQLRENLLAIDQAEKHP